MRIWKLKEMDERYRKKEREREREREREKKKKKKKIMVYTCSLFIIYKEE